MIKGEKMDSKESILIVDDNEGARRSLALFFRQKGYEVDTAQTGQEAIEKVQGRFFNMALLDIRLPDIDGVELLAPLKEIHPDMVAIMVTAYASLENAVRALNNGAFAYITKPVNMDGVLATVREGLEKQHLVVENRRLYQATQKELAERKRAEEELLETNRSLEEALGELRATQKQIIQQERLRALGQIESGIAHDFNNALTPILGYSELIFMLPAILDDKEKMMNYLKLMNTAAKDASNVVMRLRNFYREREEDETLVSVNLNRLVKQTIELTEAKWKDQAQSNGITISVSTDLQQVPQINGNESELRNASTNLIFNAVDAMPEGGTLTIRTHSDDEYVVLELSDTGVGMTNEVKQRCFEPFFSTKGESGTGLGLSMVHGIIRRHKGTIEIQSKEGEGTTVIIRLPILVAEQAESEEQETGAITRSLHVLLVDDEPDVRDIISRYLLADGHTVETANNGREGLENFYKSWFDLVITDRAMPGMNGIQLASLIKEIAPNKPIIMLTGFGDMMKITGDIPADVDYLLSKPVKLNDFREALAKVTEH